MRKPPKRFDSIDRNKEENWKVYMKYNPIYFNDFFPGKTIDEAWRELRNIGNENIIWKGV